MQIKGLNETDNKIVELLVNNARATYSEIGENVGLSRVAVKNRIDALEKNGIINGYHAEINQNSVPDSIMYFLIIETPMKKYYETLQILKDEPTVQLVLQMSGRNAIFAVCNSETKQARLDFMKKMRETLDGVSLSEKEILSVDKGVILNQ